MIGSSSIIAEEIARRTGISPQDIIHGDRTKRLAQARHAVYFLTRRLTGLSYPQIGRLVHKDHSTVMHGVDRCRALMARDSRYRAMVFDVIRACRTKVKVRSMPRTKMGRPKKKAPPEPAVRTRAPEPVLSIAPPSKPLPPRGCCVTGCGTTFCPDSPYQTRCPLHRREDAGMFEGYAV